MKTTELKITVSIEMVDKLTAIASAQHTDIQHIAKNFIHDGVEKALPKTIRKNYFTYMKEFLRRHKVPTEAINEFPEKFTY